MMPGWPELILILVLVLVLFGAGRLPQVFEAMGDGIRRFRQAQEGLDEDDDAPAAPRLADKGPAVSDASEVEASQRAAKS